MSHDPTAHEVDEALLQQLPIFPLPNVVLFPGAVLPLHVFEPRYRDLVRYALDHGQVIGIPLLQPGYTAEEYEGSPPIHEIFGVGRLAAHQSLSDGRSNILLHGVERLQMVEELHTDYGFRMLKAARLPDLGEVAADQLETIKILTLKVAAHLPQARDALTRLISEALHPANVIDQLAAYLVGDLQARQQLLELTDVSERVARLSRHLGALLLQMSDPQDEGGPLN